MLYTLNLYNVTCQSHFNKAGRNIFYIIIALDTTEQLHFHFHFHALEKEMATHSVLLPGESQGRESLVGCRLWGRTESDTTEAT